jgi:hypothetical protein
MGDVTPDQIATFDQALADVESNLDVLIDMWRTGDPDSPEHIRIAGLCVALGDSEWDRIAFVEILVAAIRRLDRAGQAATPDDVESLPSFGRLVGRGRLKIREAATPDGPRRWALPDEPGPEVTAVRDRLGRTWSRVRGLPLWGSPETGSVLPFIDLLDHYGPLTDATPAAGGQDGDGR